MSASTLSAPEPKPMPTAFCEECGRKFHRKMTKQKFCQPSCQRANADRMLAGGYLLYPLVMRWRIDRDRDSLSELCSVADRLAYDERQRRQKRKERVALYKAAPI